MNQLHIIGGKNNGKTTLVTDLVGEFARRGIAVGTVKHTHHQHELDIPGKDSHRHRMAGAVAVGILSSSMAAMFVPVESEVSNETNRYAIFTPIFAHCRLILVEGDSHANAPKIEVWRRELGTPPLALRDESILAVVTDDPLTISTKILPRFNVTGLADWIESQGYVG